MPLTWGLYTDFTVCNITHQHSYCTIAVHYYFSLLKFFCCINYNYILKLTYWKYLEAGMWTWQILMSHAIISFLQVTGIFKYFGCFGVYSKFLFEFFKVRSRRIAVSAMHMLTTVSFRWKRDFDLGEINFAFHSSGASYSDCRALVCLVQSTLKYSSKGETAWKV